MSVESVVEANRLIADKKLEEIQELSGTLRVLRSISDVKDVVCEIAHWYVLDRTRAAYESFKSGITCLGLLDAVIKNSDLFQRVFCFYPQVLSSDSFEQLFVVNRSEQLSNRWEVENRLLAFWRDFLLDVEEKECELIFSDILIFASGLRVVPCRSILLQLEFLHEPEKNGLLSKFPKANTCSCILRLPVVHTQYVDFKSDFQFAVRNAKGFGIPLLNTSWEKLE